MYRCIASNGTTSITSFEATMSLPVAYAFTKDLEDKSAAVGETVVFEVEAPGTVTYQWQYSTDSGKTWSNWGGNVFSRIAETNNLALVKYNGNAANVEVPNIVDGMSVTEIGKPLADGEKGVFEDNTSLTSIKLPNSIAVIRERAFKGCSNLSTMTTY